MWREAKSCSFFFLKLVLNRRGKPETCKTKSEENRQALNLNLVFELSAVPELDSNSLFE